jgi:hypothetical protein
MGRKLRIQYPGAMYHVMNRGERKEDAFIENADRSYSLPCLGPVVRNKDVCSAATTQD